MKIKFVLRDKLKDILLVTTIFNLVVLILCSSLFLMVYNNTNYENEDVNRDGEVNALDLLIVQKKLLEEEQWNQ